MTGQLRDGEYRLELNGIAHWVRVAGARRGGVPLVVVHGGPGGNTYNFERTIGPRLEAFTTVIYYDQRGCGRSDPPPDPHAYSLPLLAADLEALRRLLGLDRVALLGFSFGAELALAYAQQHPEPVHALILQAPTLMTTRPSRTFWTQLWGFYHLAEGGLRERIARLLSDDGPLEERWLQAWSAVDVATVDRFLFHQPGAAALNRRLWRESGMSNTGDMLRALMRQPRPLDALQALAGIRAPTLVIVGLHDRNTGVDACRDLAALIPGARLVVFEHSAHFPEIEEPERYANEVRRFLDEVARAGGAANGGSPGRAP